MSHTYVWHDSFVHVAWLFQMCGITYFYAWRDAVILVQPVPAKTRLEMLVEMQIEILDGQCSGLFSNEPFEQRLVMTIEEFVLHSNDHFESCLRGNGL